MATRLVLPILLLIFALASAIAGVVAFTPEHQLLSELGLPPQADGASTGNEDDGAAETGAESGGEIIELGSLSIPATIPEGTKLVVSLGLLTTEHAARQRAAELGPRGPAQGVQKVVDANGRPWFMSLLGPVESLSEANRIAMFVRSRHGIYPTIHLAPVPPKE